MGLSWSHILIVLVLFVLLFGRGKISELMGDVAQGIKAFKKGMAEDDAGKAAAPEPSLAHKTIDHQPGEPSLKSRAQTEEKAEGSNV
jgi:sec-independent protein translocase protein TatA